MPRPVEVALRWFKAQTQTQSDTRDKSTRKRFQTQNSLENHDKSIETLF